MQFSFSNYLRKYNAVFLAFFWIAGMLFGAMAAESANADMFLWMGSAGRCRASIVALLCVAFLPFLFTALAVYFSKSTILFGICFLRSAFLGYMLRGMMLHLGSGFWLYGFLLLFTTLCLLPLDCWLWVRYTSGRQSFRVLDLLIYVFTAFIIVALDHCFVAPLLADVMLF